MSGANSANCSARPGSSTKSSSCPLKGRTQLPNLDTHGTTTDGMQDMTAHINKEGPKCPIMKQMSECMSNGTANNQSKRCAIPDVKINGISNGRCDGCNTNTKVPPKSDTISPDICGSPARKTSNISEVSSSGGSEEVEEGERKLDLRGLIEGIGTLLIPAVSTILRHFHISLCMLGFCIILSSAELLYFFGKILSGIPSVSNSLWIQIRPRRLVGPVLDPNYLTLIVFLKEYF